MRGATRVSDGFGSRMRGAAGRFGAGCGGGVVSSGVDGEMIPFDVTVIRGGTRVGVLPESGAAGLSLGVVIMARLCCGMTMCRVCLSGGRNVVDGEKQSDTAGITVCGSGSDSINKHDSVGSLLATSQSGTQWDSGGFTPTF